MKKSEQIALEEGYRTSKTHIRERYKCILMSDAGYDVNEIADFFGVLRHTPDLTNDCNILLKKQFVCGTPFEAFSVH